MGTAEDSLFFALAQDLKTPLTRIAYKAQLGTKDKNSLDIQHIATSTLSLLDAYLLGAQKNTQLALEPVSPSAVMQDAAQDLAVYAKRFSCQLQLDVPSHSGYILTNRSALKAAVAAIAKVFIDAQDLLDTPERSIRLSAYKTGKGFSVGVFHSGSDKLLTTQLFSRAKSHVGTAARPFVGLASGAASQLFVAEQLLSALHTNLRVAHRGNMNGLAIDVIISAQMQLV